ncbi:MAG: hypothetical protein IPL96_05860 [Holophagaceae bacterium]|nr:hypothetical protein [Holophagaceae bacterium]
MVDAEARKGGEEVLDGLEAQSILDQGRREAKIAGVVGVDRHGPPGLEVDEVEAGGEVHGNETDRTGPGPMQAVTRQSHGLHHGSGLEVFVHVFSVSNQPISQRHAKKTILTLTRITNAP